jgi:hypothetical protein
MQSRYRRRSEGNAPCNISLWIRCRWSTSRPWIRPLLPTQYVHSSWLHRWLCLWTVFSIGTGFTNDVFLSSLCNWKLRWNVSDRKITDQLSHPCKAARRLTGKQLAKQVSERQNEASPYCKLCTADLIASWSRLKYFCGHLTHRAQTDISAFWNACSRNTVLYFFKNIELSPFQCI